MEKFGRVYKFPFRKKLSFYWDYFYKKVFSLWYEVEYPKFRMFLYEIMYSLIKVFNYSFLLPSPFNDNVVKTKFGTFRVRPRTVDMICVSPAYERKDIDFLLNLINKLLKQNKKVLFIDVGAGIGTYTITVGNKYQIDVFSIEPNKSNFQILSENIILNSLTKVKLFNFALFSSHKSFEIYYERNDIQTTSKLKESETGFITKTLDDLCEELKYPYDVLIMKIDVEGYESEILKGGKKFLEKFQEIYLCVEDFINNDIVKFLEKNDFIFINKFTTYNSW